MKFAEKKQQKLSKKMNNSEKNQVGASLLMLGLGMLSSEDEINNLFSSLREKKRKSTKVNKKRKEKDGSLANQEQ